MTSFVEKQGELLHMFTYCIAIHDNIPVIKHSVCVFEINEPTK